MTIFKLPTEKSQLHTYLSSLPVTQRKFRLTMQEKFSANQEWLEELGAVPKLSIAKTMVNLGVFYITCTPQVLQEFLKNTSFNDDIIEVGEPQTIQLAPMPPEDNPQAWPV